MCAYSRLSLNVWVRRTTRSAVVNPDHQTSSHMEVASRDSSFSSRGWRRATRSAVVNPDHQTISHMEVASRDSSSSSRGWRRATRSAVVNPDPQTISHMEVASRDSSSPRGGVASRDSSPTRRSGSRGSVWQGARSDATSSVASDEQRRQTRPREPELFGPDWAGDGSHGVAPVDPVEVEDLVELVGELDRWVAGSDVDLEPVRSR
jgi:hypothetical protein